MSVKKFCWLLNEANVGKNDKVWFPRWVRRYASMAAEGEEGGGRCVGGQETASNPAEETTHSASNLSVTEAEVIRFLRTLRDNGTPAWQRLQAVRAVELYRNLVLKTDRPALHEIRQTLGRLADRDRATGTHYCGANGDHRELVGVNCWGTRTWPRR